MRWLRWLAERNVRGDALFVSEKRGLRLTPDTLGPIIRRAALRAGLNDCTPHTLRRTFAVTCVQSGMNIYALARLMGHEDIHTLRHYLPLNQGDLRDPHRQYGPADRI